LSSTISEIAVLRSFLGFASACPDIGSIKMKMEYQWNNANKKTEVVAEMLVTCPSNHENLTWIVLGSNWFLRDDRPVNNLPSQGTDIRRRHSPLFFLFGETAPSGP
jgi:hypothetical protein